jgi:hypothetical protein
MVEVDAVRLAGHRIQFTRTSDKNNESKTWVEVTNPYGNTISEMTMSIPSAIPEMIEPNPLF